MYVTDVRNRNGHRNHNRKTIIKESNKNYKYVAGIDEAGRGALCGPVVASCACFKKRNRLRLADSKELTPRRREELFEKITRISDYSFGLVREDTIDKINIFWASQLAFLKAIEKFLKTTGFNKQDVLFIIDGPYFKYQGYNTKCVIAADKTVKVVSAASILAKVLRDKIMVNYDALFSGWGFLRHKGYATREHRSMIRQRGLSPIHRLSFNLMGRG